MSTAFYKCSYPYCQGHTAPYMICVGSSADVYAGIATRPAPQLTEADVRRIVREELARTPPQSHGEKQT
jgi:hypothetical protein